MNLSTKDKTIFGICVSILIAIGVSFYMKYSKPSSQTADFKAAAQEKSLEELEAMYHSDDSGILEVLKGEKLEQYLASKEELRRNLEEAIIAKGGTLDQAKSGDFDTATKPPKSLDEDRPNSPSEKKPDQEDVDQHDDKTKDLEKSESTKAQPIAQPEAKPEAKPEAVITQKKKLNARRKPRKNHRFNLIKMIKIDGKEASFQFDLFEKSVPYQVIAELTHHRKVIQTKTVLTSAELVTLVGKSLPIQARVKLEEKNTKLRFHFLGRDKKTIRKTISFKNIVFNEKFINFSAQNSFQRQYFFKLLSTNNLSHLELYAQKK